MLLIKRRGVVQKPRAIMVIHAAVQAIRGKARCRIHGGAIGSGAPRGNANGQGF